MDMEKTTALMAALGRKMDLARVLAFEEVGTWELDFDERTALLVDWNAANDSLVLSGVIARPHPAREAAYHRVMLEYNYQWQQTSGVRMAIDPDGGEAVLIYEMPVAQADPAQLETVVGNLHALLRHWRDALQSEGGGDGGDRIPFSDPHEGGGFYVKI